MPANKTLETENSVIDFINSIPDQQRKKDSSQLVEIMTSVLGWKAKMWGPSIIGFGSYHYKYESGREGDMAIVAFSPRKNAISFYMGSKFEKREELLKKLGKYTGEGCIYVKKLEDIDIAVLKKMIAASSKRFKNKKEIGRTDC